VLQQKTQFETLDTLLITPNTKDKPQITTSNVIYNPTSPNDQQIIKETPKKVLIEVFYK
jgi:hypothetical protein